MKKTAKLSIVAMRVCVKCMKSAASSTAQQPGTKRPPKSLRAKTHSSGSISTPKSVPMKRQPKGVTPKSRIPTPIRSLPSGGWLIS